MLGTLFSNKDKQAWIKVSQWIVMVLKSLFIIFNPLLILESKKFLANCKLEG